MENPLRIIGKNLGTFVLALALAMTVWVSAVLSANPNQNCVTPRRIPLVVQGESNAYMRSGDIPAEVSVIIRAPRSICQELGNSQGSMTASIDMIGLGAGDHQLDVNLQINENIHPYQLISLSPVSVSFTLEELATKTIALQPTISGQPAPGYNLGLTILSDSKVVISGTKSLVDQVIGATVVLDISDANEEIKISRPVQLLDANGEVVSGLSLSPETVEIRQIIERPGTFRDVTVRVVYEGQPAEGYRLTNITSSPAVITVFSPNQQIIREMPGFVETTSVNLTGAVDDIEERVSLLLPDGVSVVGEQSVLVQISIAAIESSQTMSIIPETIGLAQVYTATLSPGTVDVIISGPLPVLDNLKPGDVRVILDLTGLQPGVYTLVPQVVILPGGLVVDSVLPAAIDVTISVVPTTTPDPALAGTTTPAVTFTPTPGVAVTPSPTPKP